MLAHLLNKVIFRLRPARRSQLSWLDAIINPVINHYLFGGNPVVYIVFFLIIVSRGGLRKSRGIVKSSARIARGDEDVAILSSGVPSSGNQVALRRSPAHQARVVYCQREVGKVEKV